MQNKALLYGVGLLVLIAVGVGVWMMASRGGTTVPGEQNATSTSQTQTTSLKNLLAQPGSQQCTFSKVSAQMQSSGTVYIANGMMRGDFTSDIQGSTTVAHMIVKEGTSYVWTDTMKQGAKMSFDSMYTQTGNAPEGTIDPNTDMEYACTSWTPEQSRFVVPTTITFYDVSASAPSGSGAGMTAQCSACNQISDPTTKAQCKLALKCSQ